MSMRERVARQDLEDAERRHERIAAAQREEAAILGSDLKSARERLRGQRDKLVAALKDDALSSLDSYVDLLTDLAELDATRWGAALGAHEMTVQKLRAVVAEVEANP